MLDVTLKNRGYSSHAVVAILLYSIQQHLVHLVVRKQCCGNTLASCWLSAEV